VGIVVANRGFSAEEIFHAATNFWWMILVCLVIGGLLGLLYSSLTEPLYEASATILLSVDRNRALVPDDITVYQANDRVRELILSDKTLQGVLERLGDQAESEFYNSPATLREHLRIAQHEASFELYFYANKPKLAADGANDWAQSSLSALEDAFLHAVRAAEFQDAIYESHCTLSLQDDGAQERAVWVCSTGWTDKHTDSLPESLMNEVMASRGILPFYSFALGREANEPNQPVLWSRSRFVIAGLGLGGLIGVLASVLIRERNLFIKESRP
jgi:hypothetical protein